MSIAPRPFVQRRSGLTLIELIAVIVILVILAGSAVPAMNRVSQSRAATAAQSLAADLTVARQYAVTSGRTVWVVFDTAAQHWSMLIEPLDGSGPADAEVMDDPATGKPFVTELDQGPFVGVRIISRSFDGEQRIGFDWRGRPQVDDETPLESLGHVELTGRYRVTVEPGSGLVTYTRP